MKSKLSYLPVVAAAILTTAVFLSAQNGSQGTITITVIDQTGAVVPGVNLSLQELATNEIRKAATLSSGEYSFVGLNIGTYKLTTSRAGYASVVYDSISVHAGLVTDINVTLKVGAISETVEVTAPAAPLVEATSSVIGSNIDMKLIENLPFGTDRDLTALAALVPGTTGSIAYNPQIYGTPAVTWNGLPGAAQVTSVDGVIGQSSRFKDFGNAVPGSTAASPRIQNIDEMSVQTDQLDANQGYGQGNMQVTFVTRSGSNRFHGRIFGDLQNSSFNANPWQNDFSAIPIPLYHKTDIGGSVGGPVIKDKLFFFFSYERDGIPGQQEVGANGAFPFTAVMTPAAQQGNYTYLGTDSVTHTVNLFTLASAQPGLATTLDASVANQLTAINASEKFGTLVSTPGVYNAQTLEFRLPNNQYFYYPTFRVDYNATQSVRVNLAFNDSKFNAPTQNPQEFPGSTFAYQTDGNKTTAYTASLGVDWTIRPTLINQFHGGFLYNWTANSPKQGDDPEKYGYINYWAGPDNLNPGSGAFFYSAVSNFYPLINLSDNVVWQHKSHNISFGASFYREQDHYWNPPQGYDNVVFGDDNGDPMNNVFNVSNPSLATATPGQIGSMQGYYAILTGDITFVGGSHPINPQTKTYQQFGALNLDELQKAWGLHFQDSWRVRPNLTVNYGLRWDFTGDDHDLNSLYYSPTQAGLWGPSGINNLFNPGSLPGEQNPAYIARGHAYNPWNVSPQPNIGIAWSPQFTEGILGKLTGGGKTVLRAGYSLRRYTEQYQSYWQYASNFGSFFYQNFQTQGESFVAPGDFQAGSLHFNQYVTAPNSIPPFLVTPPSYSAQISEASQAWQSPFQGMNPNIAQPYIQSWNVGFQRELGKSNAIEVRYVGNHGVHEWVGENINEVNIFENGFLQQFKAAQTNMQINQNNGITSFANNGFPGQQATPIFDAAFAGEPSGGPGVPLLDYGPNNPFIQELQLGEAGTMASQIASPFGFNANYFCNLISPSSVAGGACQANLQYTGTGGNYPVNFFQANPYNAGSSVGYLTSSGYSNYNGLQLEFRQKQWHGMQFNANYTWSKNLAMTQQYTLRNLRLAYGPNTTDRRNVMNAYGTYDLPFGEGKQFLSSNSLLNRVVGGWTLGTVVTYTSGFPFQLVGGNDTFNNIFDGGVLLNGVTASQIQHAIGVYANPACPSGQPCNSRAWINPKFIAASGIAAPQITPNNVPGSIGYRPWFYAMHHFTENLSVTKAIAIAEGLKFNVQGVFLNVFNHPEWDLTTGCNGACNNGLQGSTFGQTSNVIGARVIEVRLNFEF
jgi:Carboxypeptidase regulatory-like domain